MSCAQCGEPLPAAARFCPACAAPVAATGPGEERKVATVLFADLAGSTELGGALDPERARALLGTFFDAMALEIAAAGGTVEKFIGDAVVAVFGAPAALEDHAERALHTALAMLERHRELFGDQLGLRIGVNTGDVVAGAARGGGSFVSGDAVNIAARLEQAAAPGEVLAGERTAAAAGGAFELGPPLVIDARGKPGGVPCRRVVRALAQARPRGVAAAGRAFVGRDAELEVLTATHRRVAVAGTPQLATLLGDSGVGKSTLAGRLLATLAHESPAPLVRTGHCLPYGTGITYWPIGEMLRQHFEILDTDSPDTIRQRLDARQDLAIALGLEAGPELHPLAARERLHAAFVELVSELASGRPVVLLVEDLHRAEDPLLDLLERVARETGGPLLLLVTARPELHDRRPGWGAGPRDSLVLRLEPLPSETADRMLSELVPGDLPPALREMILARSEGNPFFLEELVGSLVDRGILARTSGGSWQATALPAELDVPDSIQGTLAARIDLLGPVEKGALQAASVIGRVFWAGPVRELTGGSEPDFRLLSERGLVLLHSGSSVVGELELSFKHAITRDVTYATLPTARRAQLHAAFAAWLERSDTRDEHAPFIAHHYAEAVRPENADLAWRGREEELEELSRRTVTWLRRAADLAVSRYELGDALGMYARALELEPAPAARVGLLRAAGHAHALRFDGDAFLAAMHQAVESGPDGCGDGETYAELVFQAAVRSGMWRRRPDRKLVASWIDRAVALSEPGTTARAKALIADAYWNRTTAARTAVEAARLAEALGDRELLSYAWDASALSAFRSGDYDGACAWAERRLGLVDEITDPGHVAEAYATAIAGHAGLGNLEECRRLAALHDTATARLTAHHRLHGVAFLLEVEYLAGAWETILALRGRVEEAVAANADTPCVMNGRSLLICAIAAAQLGRPLDARRLEERADALGFEGYETVLGTLRMRLALHRGDADAVDRHLSEPLPEQGQNWYLLSAVAARLDALAALGDRDRVESEAEPLARAGTYLEPFALRALGTVRDDPGLRERAAAAFAAMGLRGHCEGQPAGAGAAAR